MVRVRVRVRVRQGVDKFHSLKSIIFCFFILLYYKLHIFIYLIRVNKEQELFH